MSIHMDQLTAQLRDDRRTVPTGPWKREEGQQDDAGPRQPDVGKPNTERLLKRMRKVDPDQARRYRQRTGE
ncbi:ubiquitin-like protein UBact [Candidatus Poribacteria bacterium]|nr:ubiquitin-like protein UBact [Candidatus Poribacteria bacterium]